MTTLSDALQNHPTGEPVYLAETTTGRRVMFFQQTSSPFDPSQLTDLLYWVRPEELAADYSDGQPITKWRDVSGNARNFANVNISQQPIYKANQLNGFGAMDLDGISQWLYTNAFSRARLDTTFIFLAKCTDRTTNERALYGTQIVAPFGGPVDLFTGFRNVSGPAFSFEDTDQPSEGTFSGAISSYGGAYQVLMVNCDNAGNVTVYLNGTSVLTGTFNNRNFAAVYPFGLGKRWNNVGLPFKGQIVESFCVNHSLNNTEMSNVNNYLNDKYFSPGLFIYSTPETRQPSSVEQNGVALTAVGSEAAVEANQNSWFYDPTAGQLYLNLTVNPYLYKTNAIQAFYQFYFATTPKTFNGNFYDSRIKSLPDLALKLQKKFSSIAEISGGDLVFNNNDSFFDSMKDFNWDAGITTIRMGWDWGGGTMAYSDYQAVGTWWNQGKIYDETDFTLNLQELTARIKKKIPFNFYMADPNLAGPNDLYYPNLKADEHGKPVQLAYGYIIGAPPVMVQTQAADVSREAIFRVAGHPIKSFVAVRVNTSNGWVNSSFATTDTDNATFTLGNDESGQPYDGTSAVSVDFFGKANPDGTLMENASDVLLDLLKYLGETDGSSHVDAASFTEAKRRLDKGNIFGTIERITKLKYSLFLYQGTDAVSIINALNAYIGAMLWIDGSGNYHYNVFWPYSRRNLLTFDDSKLRNLKDITEDIFAFSKVTLNHSQRLSEQWGEFISYEVPPSQYLHRQKSPILPNDLISKDPANIQESPFVPTSDPVSAKYYSQRFLVFEGRPSRLYELDIMSPDAFVLNPGDQIHIQYKPNGDGTFFLDAVVDIIEIQYRLAPEDNKSYVSVICSDLRGWKDNPGWWCDSSWKLPTFLSGFAGYGTGDIKWNKNWHRIIKDYARQSFGYWTKHGYADPTDPESVIPSSWT